MNQKDFDAVVQEVINDIVQVLTIKGKEYTSDLDRLRNFKDAANFLGYSDEEALLGFVTKHIIALKDFIHLDAAGDDSITKEQWNEKIGDIINYMILLKALLREKGKA